MSNFISKSFDILAHDGGAKVFEYYGFDLSKTYQTNPNVLSLFAVKKGKVAIKQMQGNWIATDFRNGKSYNAYRFLKEIAGENNEKIGELYAFEKRLYYGQISPKTSPKTDPKQPQTDQIAKAFLRAYTLPNARALFLQWFENQTRYKTHFEAFKAVILPKLHSLAGVPKRGNTAYFCTFKFKTKEGETKEVKRTALPYFDAFGSFQTQKVLFGKAVLPYFYCRFRKDENLEDTKEYGKYYEFKNKNNKGEKLNFDARPYYSNGLLSPFALQSDNALFIEGEFKSEIVSTKLGACKGFCGLSNLFYSGELHPQILGELRAGRQVNILLDSDLLPLKDRAKSYENETNYTDPFKRNTQLANLMRKVFALCPNETVLMPNGWGTKLIDLLSIVIVNPETKQKGLDDLLNSLSKDELSSLRNEFETLSNPLQDVGSKFATLPFFEGKYFVKFTSKSTYLHQKILKGAGAYLSEKVRTCNYENLPHVKYFSDTFEFEGDLLLPMHKGVCRVLHIPTGRGKTSGLVSIAKRLFNEKEEITIIAVPTNKIAKQQAGSNAIVSKNKMFKESDNGFTKFENFVVGSDFQGVIFSNYANLEKTFAALKELQDKEMISEINVVIDEFHDVLKSASYKDFEDLARVFEVLESANKGVVMSATPIFGIEKLFSNLKFLPLKFQFAGDKELYKINEIVEYKSKKDLFGLSENRILENAKNNKFTLYFLNNVSELKALQSGLKQRNANLRSLVIASEDKLKSNGFSESEIELANELTNSNDKQTIVSILSQYDVIFATSILDFGVNLFTDGRKIETISVQNQKGYDYTTDCQRFNRFRDGENNKVVFWRKQYALSLPHEIDSNKTVSLFIDKILQKINNLNTAKIEIGSENENDNFSLRKFINTKKTPIKGRNLAFSFPNLKEIAKHTERLRIGFENPYLYAPHIKAPTFDLVQTETLESATNEFVKKEKAALQSEKTALITAFEGETDLTTIQPYEHDQTKKIGLDKALNCAFDAIGSTNTDQTKFEVQKGLDLFAFAFLFAHKGIKTKTDLNTAGFKDCVFRAAKRHNLSPYEYLKRIATIIDNLPKSDKLHILLSQIFNLFWLFKRHETRLNLVGFGFDAFLSRLIQTDKNGLKSLPKNSDLAVLRREIELGQRAIQLKTNCLVSIDLIKNRRLYELVLSGLEANPNVGGLLKACLEFKPQTDPTNQTETRPNTHEPNEPQQISPNACQTEPHDEYLRAAKILGLEWLLTTFE